jgi:hypothetical protein
MPVGPQVHSVGQPGVGQLPVTKPVSAQAGPGPPQWAFIILSVLKSATVFLFNVSFLPIVFDFMISSWFGLAGLVNN